MSAVATAIAGSAVLGYMSSKQAGQQQADAANAATQSQQGMFNVQNAQQAPWRQAGETALKQLTAGTAEGGQFAHQFGASDLNSMLSPNYQFQLEQGLGQTKNAINATGGMVSGNEMQGINQFAQNYAGNAYQNAFNNYQTQQSNIFNRLSNIAGLGQQSNQTTAGLAGAISPGIANTMTAAGNAQAAGIMGGANAISGAVGQGISYNYLNSLKQ
jgi:hypothetical protein